MLELMLPALVASLILVGIHGYLGIHIIARGVIFVDLALAQVAALGWAVAGLGEDLLEDPGFGELRQLVVGLGRVGGRQEQQAEGQDEGEAGRTGGRRRRHGGSLLGVGSGNVSQSLL